MNKTTKAAVDSFLTDLKLERIDYARPTVHWADRVGQVAANIINSLRDDKRVSKVDVYMAIRDRVKTLICHDSEVATDMAMSEAAETLLWLDCNGYLGKADQKKLEGLR